MRSSDGVFDRLDRLYQSGITKLVYTLVGTDAALNLSSQIYDQKAGFGPGRPPKGEGKL